MRKNQNPKIHTDTSDAVSGLTIGLAIIAALAAISCGLLKWMFT